jgi:hypothetical protein
MYVSSPVSWTAPHVPASVDRFSGMTPSRIARSNGLRRNGENIASSLPSVCTLHSPADQSA